MRVESLAAEDDHGALNNDGKHAEDGAKAVEERWLAAEDVVGSEVYAATDEESAIHEVLDS